MQNRDNLLYENCGIREDMFPCLGICCSQDKSFLNTAYVKVCPYCQISTSLPSGTSLRTASIFECSRLGYGRRVTK